MTTKIISFNKDRLMKSRLLKAEMIEALKQYPLYSQDDKRGDAVCVAVLGIANIRWYILEGEQQGDDFTFFGVVTGMYQTEYGYFSLSEMESIEVNGDRYGLPVKLHIEVIEGFKPCKLKEIKDKELQDFLANF